MIDGKKRVIIENIQPVVDHGLFPAKRTVGERVDVTAAILGMVTITFAPPYFIKKKSQVRGWRPR